MLRFSAETHQMKIRDKIEELLREAAPGDKLPSQPELAARFGCSRTMIQLLYLRLSKGPFIKIPLNGGIFNIIN